MSFQDRIQEYQTMMGLTVTEHAAILGVSISTFWEYRQKDEAVVSGKKKKGSTPPFKKLIEFADMMYVSLDWLIGRIDSPPWAPCISELRQHLYLAARDMKTSLEEPVVSRVAAIIRTMQSFDPRFEREWFVAGVLHISQDRLREVMNEECGVDEELLGHFCRFTGLSEMWTQLGEDHFLETPNLGEYVSANRRLRDEGITGEQLESAIPMLKRLLAQMNPK